MIRQLIPAAALVMLVIGCGKLSESPTPTEFEPVVQEPVDYPNPINTPLPLCRENTLICIPAMWPEDVARHHGQLVGGTYNGGIFTNIGTGGIEFPLTLDVSRQVVVEFEIEGNIANWQSSEHNGGKVGIFHLKGEGNNYYVSFQRMYYSYKNAGGGLFRVIVADRGDILSGGSGFLITSYSMRSWGSEIHAFKVVLQGNHCQLFIDNQSVGSVSSQYGISGNRRVTLMLGNRVGKTSQGEGAITRFRNLKLYYQ